MIPTVNIAPLFDESSDNSEIDRHILKAASEIGFLRITGVPATLQVDQSARDELLKLFSIPDDAQRKLWKQNFAPENENLYRGWFPTKSGAAQSREGYEIGPDIARDLPDDGSDDLLYEPTPIPPDTMLPGWKTVAKDYFLAMETIGNKILASLSRGLKIDEAIFREGFRDGISTLRLLRYPARDPNADISDLPDTYFTSYNGARYELIARAHADSGLLTILAQCGVDGLQAQARDGSWIEVPPIDDGFAINFGGLLERWTGGKVKATIHRVISPGQERFSVPFFFEPRPNTIIAPLPIDGVKPFEPFQFGDHLWSTTTKFPENFGLQHLRPNRGAYTDPMA